MIDADTLNYVYPITRLKLYKNGIEIIRESQIEQQLRPSPKDIPKRGEITTMSRKSLSRLAFLVRNTDVEFRSILTLTYPQQWPRDGKECKRHLNRFMVEMRRYFDALDYVWFLEFQQRGAPHYHILLSVEYNRFNHDWMADLWSEIVAPDVTYSDLSTRVARSMRLQCRKVHAHKRAYEEIRDKDGAAKYAAKYAMKPYQKIVPDEYKNVGRFWGNSRNVKKQMRPIDEIDIGDIEEAVGYVLSKRPDAEKFDVLPKLIFT